MIHWKNAIFSFFVLVLVVGVIGTFFMHSLESMNDDFSSPRTESQTRKIAEHYLRVELDKDGGQVSDWIFDSVLGKDDRDRTYVWRSSGSGRLICVHVDALSDFVAVDTCKR